MLITFYRIDADGEVHYYCINNRQGHLFSRYAFSVTSGMALRDGRERLYTFDSRREMDEKMRALITARIRAGYRVLYSYFRSGEYRALRPVLRKAASS